MLAVLAAACAAALVVPAHQLLRSAGPGRRARRDGSRHGPVVGAALRRDHARGARRAPPRGSAPLAPRLPGPLLLELVAALLESGAPPPVAVRTIGGVLSAEADPRGAVLLTLAVHLEHGGPVPVDAHLHGDPGLAALVEAMQMAVSAGLPPAVLVRRAAAEERRRLSSAQRRAVRRLEILLVLPVGLCLLPAFVLLGIAPMVIDLLGGS